MPFYYKLEILDKEYLELFLDNFWSEVVSPLEDGNYVHLIFLVDNGRFFHQSKVLSITNNSESKDYFYKQILGGPVGSHLNIHESILLPREWSDCYIWYQFL